MTLITTKFKSGGLHEKHVAALGNLGTTSAFAFRPRETKKKPEETKKKPVICE
jgi:hypothetical protein